MMTQQTHEYTAADAPAPPLTHAGIMARLAHHTGTEKWHHMGGGFLITDGVKDFADIVGGYWVIDAIRFEFVRPFLRLDDRMTVIKLTVNRTKATTVPDAQITMHDREEVKRKTKNIHFTDCPDGEYKFYLQLTGDEKYPLCLCLPSEY